MVYGTSAQQRWVAHCRLFFAWWHDFSARYVTALCATKEATESNCIISKPAAHRLDELLVNAPLMTGSEYLTVDVLLALWDELDAAFRVEVEESKKHFRIS